MIENPFALIALAAYCAAVLRLLVYRKNGARHRRHISWLAWLVLVILGGSAIELMLAARQITMFEAGRAALLSLFVFGARGNVARLFWSEPR